MNPKIKRLIKVVTTASAIALFGEGLINASTNPVTVNAKKHTTKKKHKKKQVKKSKSTKNSTSANTSNDTNVGANDAEKQYLKDPLNASISDYNVAIGAYIQEFQDMDTNTQKTFFLQEEHFSTMEIDRSKSNFNYPHSFNGMADSARSLSNAINQAGSSININSMDAEAWANDRDSLSSIVGYLNDHVVPDLSKKLSAGQVKIMKDAYQERLEAVNNLNSISSKDSNQDDYKKVMGDISATTKYLQTFANIVGSIK
ncbi:hypothetical protein [Nicoliella lavandulae]|uniref:Uncharacterized protein n=1 Tax=Nicoliella lavandulae TaxID=3082954 RepID=A0ABU8SM24_9LACO